MRYTARVPQVILVLRRFETAVEIEELDAMVEQNGWCFDAHQAERLVSYVASDKRSTLCVFRAPDAESVRLANAKAQIPVDRVWTATEYPGPGVASVLGELAKLHCK